MSNFATLVYVTNPFRPADHRLTRRVPRRRKVSSLVPQTSLPYICLLNGEPLLRKQWSKRLRRGDVVTFISLPQGGGGGGGSNPIRTVAMIAVMVAAPQLAPSFLTGAIGSTAAGAVMTMAGMAVLNMVLPPPRPPASHVAAQLAAPSPTYSLQSQGNTARLGASIPVLYGRHCIFPDYASQPYSEYVNNQQYTNLLFCIGQGSYSIEQIRFDKTPITAYGGDVVYQVIPPNGNVTLFDVNVVTSVDVAGQEMMGRKDLTWVATQQSAYQWVITFTETAHGRAALSQVRIAGGTGVLGDYTWQISAVTANTWSINYFYGGAPTATSGNASVYVPLGGFYGFAATPSGVASNKICIDIAFPSGLGVVNTNGGISAATATWTVEYAQMPFGGTWTTLASETLTLATNTPQRISYIYGVVLGRYTVRVTRTDVKSLSAQAFHTICWQAMDAYVPSSSPFGYQFGNVTLLAMRVRSSALTQTAAQKLNVICTRQLPIFDVSTGTMTPWIQPTKSIMWALVDAASNTDYGGKIPLSQINLQQLYALDQVCTARGDFFNGVFDNTVSLWEAMSSILRAGRAKPYLLGGVLNVVRDQSQAIPVSLFSMRNIVANSFSVEYAFPSDATTDSVEMTYFDESVWMQRTVMCTLPNGTANNPSKVTAFGMTNRDQAHREGMYIAACNFYRRKVVKFQTEMDGFIPVYGDLIAIQHDMIGWGQHGEVIGYDYVTGEIEVSDDLIWQAGHPHYMGFRGRDGSLSKAIKVASGSTANRLKPLESIPIQLDIDGQRQRTLISFGAADKWRQLAIVTQVTPRGLEHVEITCVTDNPTVHLAETLVPTPPWVGV